MSSSFKIFLFVLCFTLTSFGFYFFYHSIGNTPFQITEQKPFTARHTVTEENVLLTPIKDIRIGMKVPAQDTENHQQSLKIESTAWRQLNCSVATSEGERISFRLLRSVQWINANQMTEGESFSFRFPDSAFQGIATVDSVQPCPEIQKGPGHLVTGKFQFRSNDLWDLKLLGSDRTIGTTGNFQFFSTSRGQFVNADQLKSGEKLLDYRGSEKEVQSITKRVDTKKVFFLEIQGLQTLRISNLGVLVKNKNLSPQ